MGDEDEPGLGLEGPDPGEILEDFDFSDIKTSASEVSTQVPDAGEEDEDTEAMMDALDRFERMVDIQIDSINEVDNKAEHLTRLLGLLLGGILTGLSVVAKAESLNMNIFTGFAAIPLFFGVGGLLLTLVLAVNTYLSSGFQYGPNPGLANYFANSRIDEREYTEEMLKGYAKAIRENEPVVIRNYRRFRDTLAAFLASIELIAISVLFVVIDMPLTLNAIIIACVLGILAYQTRYLRGEEYLVQEYGNTDNE